MQSVGGGSGGKGLIRFVLLAEQLLLMLAAGFSARLRGKSLANAADTAAPYITPPPCILVPDARDTGQVGCKRIVRILGVDRSASRDEDLAAQNWGSH